MVGPYRLERPLGEGAVGAVWLATHGEQKAPVAIKFIRQEFAHSQAVVDRFRFEAQATAQLTSPHIVRVWHFGETDFGSYYYASEYVQGTDLETLVTLVHYPKHGPCTSRSKSQMPSPTRMTMVYSTAI